MNKISTLILETRKVSAKERFLKFMRRMRFRKDFPDAPDEAFLQGLKEGYRAGFLDGLKLEDELDQDDTFEALEVGVA